MQAVAVAGSRDVRPAGGVATIRQFLRSTPIDELHLAIRPFLLGSGENFLNGIDMRALGYECAECVASERTAHVLLRKCVEAERTKLIGKKRGARSTFRT
jgi:dihydrofolate reductase